MYCDIYVIGFVKYQDELGKIYTLPIFSYEDIEDVIEWYRDDCGYNYNIQLW